MSDLTLVADRWWPIVEHKNDPGNGYTRTLLCFIQLFIVSNRSETVYFANNNARHFAFNADERFLPVYRFADRDNKPATHLDDFAGVRWTLLNRPKLQASALKVRRGAFRMSLARPQGHVQRLPCWTSALWRKRPRLAAVVPLDVDAYRPALSGLL